MPKLTASGDQIAAAVAGHGTAVAAQFALTEGCPPGWPRRLDRPGFRAAAQVRAVTAARVALIASATAALVSLAQFVLARNFRRRTWHRAPDAVNRLDGSRCSP
jgi:hypothetical protein